MSYEKEIQYWCWFVAFYDLIEQFGPEENPSDIIYDDDDDDNDDIYKTTTTTFNAPLQFDSQCKHAPQRRSTSVKHQKGGGKPAREAQQNERRQQLELLSPDCVNMSHHRYICMRWYDLFFVSPNG